MQQTVDADNRRNGRSLGLRVGLGCGEASREADDYFGDPVIAAARLCARAEGGQILASDLVRAMAGRRSRHSFRSIGELELKGLPDPLLAIEVNWERVGDTEALGGRVPLPSRLAVRPNIGVIGREVEADLLSDAFKRVAAGEGREVILISGEAGIGKTTLAAQAAGLAAAAGSCVLLGRCEEDLGSPYQPFVEALHHYITHGPDEVLTSHIRSHGGELARIVPALGHRLAELPPPQTTDPDTERYLLFGSVVGLLSQVSTSQCLIVVLEDLQWADKPSLQLLRHVVTSTEPVRLLVIGTYRDSELSGGHPLTETLVALRREPGVSRIELRGLDDVGVVTFLEASAGHGLDDAGIGLAHAVYRETDGNPFFVGEMLQHLAETGAIYQDNSGRWSAGDDLAQMTLPDSVREVIGSRVARLGEGPRRVLSFAAVIGRDFDLELLALITERSDDELLDILDRAVTAALGREVRESPGRYSFSHVLIQHTLHDDMGGTRRARAHRQVAEALESLCAGRPGQRVGELAHHWLSATQPTDAAKAIFYAQQAGDAALAALAPDDAVRYFSQATQLLAQLDSPDPLQGVDLLLGLGNAQRQVGNVAFRETLLEAAHRARDLGAKEKLVAGALMNNRGIYSAIGVIDTERVDVLELALDAMSDVDSDERARLLATLCNELSYGPLERRRALADEAKAMARRLGEPATIIRVLNLVETALEVPWHHSERFHDSAEALALAEARGDPVHLYWAATFCHVNAIQAGDFELSVHCLTTMQALSERLRQPILMWCTTYHEAGHALVTGDHGQAEKLANNAFQIGTDSGQPDAFTFFATQVGAVRYQQGRLSELKDIITQLAEDNPGVPTYRSALALAHLEASEDDDALRYLRAASGEGFEFLPEDTTWMDGIVNYAAIAIELQDRPSALKLFDLLQPFHAQIPFEGLIPREPVAAYLGGLATVIARYDEAEAYFAEASELNARGNMKFADAYTQLLWGRMVEGRSTGDSERASQLLRRARVSAGAEAFAMVERRATAALSNLG